MRNPGKLQLATAKPPKKLPPKQPPPKQQPPTDPLDRARSAYAALLKRHQAK